MDRPPPPPPLLPDAVAPSTSLPPPFISDPAATPLPPTLTPSPVATPTTSPARNTPFCEPTGRSKAQRWCRDTPPSGKSGGASQLSFKEALLHGIAACTTPPCLTPSSPSDLPRHAGPRIVVRLEARRSSIPGTDADGWVTAVSRKMRLAARRAERRPPRPVPVDLRGKCFNCFSSRHRAAFCKSSTRCFRCRETGHMSYICPDRRAALPATASPRLVWRPVVASPTAAAATMATPADTAPAAAATMATPSDTAPTAAATQANGDAPVRLRRRARNRPRRGSRGQPSFNPEALDVHPSPALSGDDHRITDVGQQQRPHRVIKRSVAITRREEELAGRALVLSVVADNPGGLVNSILPAVAQRFEIEERLLSLYPLGPASFLLVSPDELSATTILNDGRPLIIPSGRLHAMRWSRFLLASAGNLPSATEIELRGIPAHAWDLDTASQLLSDCCLPCGLHHRTNVQRDVFRLVAWCSNPRDIPPGIDLVITEPTSGGETHEQRGSSSYNHHGDGGGGPRLCSGPA
ncbi:hypothetical protein PVAP13_3NG258011 [Panicum virgatum]|uniref:CCHC-type domain-containing protein n=1 Tax=Panicum virgatum TaxID=38727 RepID=A0A8T0UAR5_PANVG|nr:hypothetical protein PVAP13_3NG258011 [Panicum virgatum]